MRGGTFPEPSAVFDTTAPARLDHIAELRDAAAAFADRQGARAEDVAIAVQEACANAVVHGYRLLPPGPMRVTAASVDGELVVDVEDQGCGLTPHVGHPGLRLGLGIITEVAQAIEIRSRRDAGTRIRMYFSRNGEE